MTDRRFPFPHASNVDEWNPHIVRHVHDEIPELKGSHYDVLKSLKDLPEEHKGKLRAIMGNDNSTALEANLKQWLTTWNAAQSILNGERKLGVYPLAYRLETVLSESLEEDPIKGSKFGGVPDFRHTYKLQHADNKDPLEVIASLWPRCGGCGENMRFLAGVDLSDWLLPIHLMTANNPTRTSYGSEITNSDIHYYQHSGLGFGRNLCADSPSHKPFFQIFYCNKPHFDSPAFDSRLQIEHRYSGRAEKLLDMETYRKAISQFVKENKIESNIPIQTLEGLKLRFDIDIPGEEFIEDWMEGVVEKHPEVFGNTAPYQFFGHPYSQQTERRYGCQNTFLGLHRMAPIINWTDQYHDLSYQIYGCLRCPGQESREIYCKTDRSCT